jgi:probable F420-dependent oxidoreductase
MPLGRVGLWLHQLDPLPWARGREIAQELESLGYAALWVPEAVNRDAMVSCTLILGATERLVAGTGIAPIYGRAPLVCNAAWQTISEAYPDRVILGLGVSHAPMVEGLHKTEYAPPLTAMRQYLDAMDASPFFAATSLVPPRRVLAALGPKMLALASERADGAHPYNVTPEHTKLARDILGPGKLLAVEQMVVLETDASAAREIARAALGIYLGLPNYVNNWKRLGFTDDDLASGGADRFIDALIAWGDEAAIRNRVEAHLDAGADHVCVQVLGEGLPLEQWRRLAPVITGA